MRPKTTETGRFHTPHDDSHLHLDYSKIEARILAAEPELHPEQQYPGSSFMVWESCPARSFSSAKDTITAFRERFGARWWNQLSQRTGRLRIRVTIEWLPK